MDDVARSKIKDEAEQVVLETNGVVMRDDQDSFLKFIAMVLKGEVGVDPVPVPSDVNQQTELGLA